MRVLFLVAAFIPFILTVQAQRNFSNYICQLSHKHHDKAFYMTVPERKVIDIGGWKVHAGIRRDRDQITVSLRRVVNVMDASYQREATKSYPITTRELPVKLEHDFGGKTDVFEMRCFPRDP